MSDIISFIAQCFSSFCNTSVIQLLSEITNLTFIHFTRHPFEKKWKTVHPSLNWPTSKIINITFIHFTRHRFEKMEKCVPIFELAYVEQRNSQFTLTCNKITFTESTQNFIKTHITGLPSVFCYRYFCLCFVEGVIQGSI